MERENSRSLQGLRLGQNALVVRPPHVGPVEGSAYDALEPFGAHYGSSMSDVHRAGMAAQKVRQLDLDRRRAWKDLRDVKKRLVADAAWLELPASEGELPLPSPPAVALPEVPPPKRDELLAEIGEMPVPDVPPFELPQCPSIPIDKWALADELLAAEIGGDYDEDIPSFLEGTL